ncbi:BAAT/acyl-CoA thioester hydrolase protein [Ostertagia ostertagi]
MASDKVIRHTTFDETTEIPWHRTSSNTSFRIVSSVDDLVASSVFCGRYITKRLQDLGRDVEIHLINGGHIVEPPYFPHHGAVYAKFQGFYCGYGGDAILHGKGQEVSWQGTIDFFKQKLGKTANMPDWDRLHHVTAASHL